MLRSSPNWQYQDAMAGINEGQPIFPRFKVLGEGERLDKLSSHDHLFTGHWHSLVPVAGSRLSKPPCLLLPLRQVLTCHSSKLSISQVALAPSLFPPSNLVFIMPPLLQSKNPPLFKLPRRVSLCSQCLAVWHDDSFIWLTHVIFYHVLSSRNFREISLGLKQRARCRKCWIQNYPFSNRLSKN